MPTSYARRLGVILAAGFISACAAQTHEGLEPLVTDRPDYTESTDVVPKGMMQFESGSTFTAAGAEHTQSIGEGLLRIGVHPRAEIRVGLNSYDIKRTPFGTDRGFEDVALGAKFAAFTGAGLVPSISVLGATTIPSGAQAFRASSYEPEAKLALSWEFNDRFSFAANTNYAWLASDEGRHGEVGLSGSLGVGIIDRVGSYVELFGFFPRGSNEPSTKYANGGLTFSINENLQLDARAGVGLNRTGAPDHFIGFGFGRRW